VANPSTCEDLFRLIHAFDIDEARVNQMQLNLKKHHAKNVRLKRMDFLAAEPEKYERVTHIQLDPSCSGSGMTNRLKFGELADQEMAKDTKRLWNLEALQRRMLVHAMSFPAVQRIVYSTCSVHEEENESVVRYVIRPQVGLACVLFLKKGNLKLLSISIVNLK
jgi:putative methyltransferase